MDGVNGAGGWQTCWFSFHLKIGSYDCTGAQELSGTVATKLRMVIPSAYPAQFGKLEK
jgi:hypothetical protein